MRMALTGGAYEAHSLAAAAQRQVNLYSEPIPQGTGEPAPLALFPTPGLRTLVTLPQAPVRGIHSATNGALYVVAGAGVYAVSTAWVATLLGSITAGRTNPVSMADNGLEMVIVDGSGSGWKITLAGNAFAQIVDPGGVFRGGGRVDYLDTFFLFSVPGTPQFQVSDSLALTFDPLYFANKEAFSDLLATLIVAKREIWLLGSETTEIWYNKGGADFPFESMPGVFINRGCAAPYSVAETDNAVYWLSQDRYGAGIVLQGAGYQATRISTYAIEAELATYPTITDAIGYTYQMAGHVFYVLNFPAADKTWAYDVTTKLWHELVWLDTNGAEHRHRANCAGAAYGIVVCGDHTSGKLYALDPAVFTDAGFPIKRLRSFPHIVADGKRQMFRQLIADMDAGNQPEGSQSIIIAGQIPDSRQIAQLVVPADAFGTPTNAIVDWTRGVVFLWTPSTTAVRRYTTTLATQSPTTSLLLASGGWMFCGDVDPLSGDLIAQVNPSGISNAVPIVKYNPTTLATLATFGTSGASPSYPTSVWAGQALACVTVNGVGYALLKEGAFSGGVAVIRTDTMAQAGFYAAVVSGSLNNRGLMCRGATGGSRGSVFLTWEGAVNGATATIPLYTVVINAGAESYNPASWPTPNSHITSSTIGTIAAAAVDPAWTTLQANSIGYDQTDGNVLLDVNTGAGPARTHYLIKVSATTAAVMWAVPLGSTGFPGTQLPGYTIAVGSVAVLPSGLRNVITTSSDALNSAEMSGIATTAGVISVIGDDVSGLLLVDIAFTSGGTSPTPVSGTASSFAGWALIGGVYPAPSTRVAVATLDPQMFLSWSDDRGHSFGNPVGISMGNTGEYLTSLQWQRLGYGRSRVFKLEWSVPVSTALMGAWIDRTPAQT